MTEFKTVKLPAYLVQEAAIVTQQYGWMSTADMVRYALRRFSEETVKILQAEAKASPKDHKSHAILKEFHDFVQARRSS
jgi:hypothetical protein